MKTGIHRVVPAILAAAAFVTTSQIGAQAASEPKAAPTPAMTPLHDGHRDFAFLLGKWKYRLKRLQNPLTGSNSWIEFDGVGTCREIWNGSAQIEEGEFTGPSGKIQGMMVRLYNPQSRQWSLNWVNAAKGTFDVPTIGSFKDGVGEFYDQEPYNGRTILVRYIWSKTTTSSPHFEQSYSEDGGKTWEVNWVTDQVRAE